MALSQIYIMRKISKNSLETRRKPSKQMPPSKLQVQKNTVAPQIYDLDVQNERRRKVSFIDNPNLKPNHEIIFQSKRHRRQLSEQQKNQVFLKLSQMKVTLQKNDLKNVFRDNRDKRHNASVKNELDDKMKKLCSYNIRNNFYDVLDNQYGNNNNNKPGLNIQTYTNGIKNIYSKLHQINRKQQLFDKNQTLKFKKRDFLNDRLDNVKTQNASLQYQLSKLQKSNYEKESEESNLMNKLQSLTKIESKNFNEYIDSHIKFLEDNLQVQNYLNSLNSIIDNYIEAKSKYLQNVELHQQNTSLKDIIFDNIHKNFAVVDNHIKTSNPQQYQSLNEIASQLQKQDQIIFAVHRSLNQYHDIVNFFHNFKKNSTINKVQNDFLDNITNETFVLQENIEEKQQNLFILQQKMHNVKYMIQREENKQKLQIQEAKKQIIKIKNEVILKQSYISQLQKLVERVRNGQDDCVGIVEEEQQCPDSQLTPRPKALKLRSFLQTSKIILSRSSDDSIKNGNAYCGHCSLKLQQQIDYCKQCFLLIHDHCNFKCTS